MDSTGLHRRETSIGSARGIAVRDWGTSNGVVIGLAFASAGYASLPHRSGLRLAALVGLQLHHRLASISPTAAAFTRPPGTEPVAGVVGALLLVANFLVTAALSCNSAMYYFGVSKAQIALATMASSSSSAASITSAPSTRQRGDDPDGGRWCALWCC